VDLDFDDHAKLTWIVVARRNGATIFSSNGHGRPLTVAHRFPHPEAGIKPREIDSDRTGRGNDQGERGRYALAADENAAEHV